MIGDAIHRALSAVGVTPERVERWLGRPCGCAERQARLNQLGWWAIRVLTGTAAQASKHLDEMLSGD